MGDIHPRAWGKTIDIVSFVQEGPGFAREMGCPGRLLGMVVHLADYVGHRGARLQPHPLAEPQDMKPARWHTGRYAPQHKLKSMRDDWPNREVHSKRTKKNSPRPCSEFFGMATTPEQAVMTRTK